jgi:hypothetical protein
MNSKQTTKEKDTNGDEVDLVFCVCCGKQVFSWFGKKRRRQGGWGKREVKKKEGEIVRKRGLTDHHCC